MPRYFLILLILLFCITCVNPPQNLQDDQPNILLFFVDDLGWQDTSVPFWKEKTPFNRRYRTPNMERMAAEGMKFTQAYATPVCSPTRISLMTGMNAARHRVTNWTLHPDKMQPMETNHEKLEFPYWNVNGLTPDSTLRKAVYATALPQILADAGYHTIHAGKAHYAAIGTPGENPLNIGFRTNIAGHAAGAPKSYLGTENFGNTDAFKDSPWPVPGLDSYYGQDIFLTEVLTREAIKEIDKSLREDNPFFLYMSLYGVHTPIMADDRFVQKYYDQGLDSTEAKYASMVEAMDKSLGDLMGHLENRNIDGETIILFMADNGGLSAVARGGEAHTHNKPLSSGKGSIHEGGIREPMIVRWPGKIEPRTVNNNYLIIEDFYPTILSLAGIKNYQTPQIIDGINFEQEFYQINGSKSSRPLFWHYPNEWGPTGPGIGAFSAIRRGDHKLIYYHLDESFELFNISLDIGETKNLAFAQPEIVTDLASTLTAHLKVVSAQMPKHKSTGKKVRWPDETVKEHMD